MELAYLREFLQLAKTLNYSEAAEQLFVSQSTLTRHMQTLEQELGGELFQRNPRSIELTRFGTKFVPFAEEFIHTEDELRRMIAVEFRGREQVTFDYDRVPSSQAVEALLQFRQEHPELELVLWHSQESVEMLRRGSVSFAVASAGQLLPGEFCEVERGKSRFAAVVPNGNPLAQKKQVTLQELAPWQLAINRMDAGQNGPFLSACREAGLKPKLYLMKSDSTFTAMVTFNQAIAIVNEKSGLQELENVARLVPIEPPIFTKRVVAYRSSPALTRGEQLFITFLMEHWNAFWQEDEPC